MSDVELLNTNPEVDWNIRVKALEEKLGYPICGAHGKRTFNPCPNKAGKGTDHVGEGRCKFHGGSASNITAKNFKHGLYSKIKTQHPMLRQKMEELALSGPEVFDLREEILKIRGLVEIMLDQKDWDRAEKFAMDVSKIVERLHNIEVGRRLVISIDNVSLIVGALTAAVVKHVPDEYTRHLIAEELGNVRLSMALPSAARQEEAIEADWKEVEEKADARSS
jgi:hypothetical protein